ncbi:MAG TPA: hypothetical protein VGB42_04875, partial [Candidatus Thermoplasmatota archaeon]
MKRISIERLRGASAALGAIVTAVLLAPAPAAAYIFPTGGYADGTDAAAITFGPLDTDLEGPSIRLLTNSTVTSGSVVLAGGVGYVNTTITETSTTDFASATERDGVDVSGGRIALERGHEVLTFDASNAFASANLSGLKAEGGALMLNGTTSGLFETGNLSAPLGGWGNLVADVNTSAGGSITFALLSPGGSVLVSPQAIGGTVDLDPISYPALRLRGTLAAPNTSVTPTLTSVTLGQRAGDFLYGTGVTRSMSDGARAGDDGGITIGPDVQGFSKWSSNPVLRVQASTYYAARVAGGEVVKVGDEYWMYVTAQSCTTCAGQIGRAVSSDGTNWTYDSSPVLSGTASSWDASGVGSPDVIPNPSGSGYLMYYSGSSGGIGSIGIATSPDAVNWTKYSGNPVLSPTASAWDSAYVQAPVVFHENGSWTMYYHGTTSSVNFQFGMATSSDGTNWTKYSGNPTITRGPSGSLDVLQVWQGDIIEVDGTSLLYYSCGGPSQFKVCLATSTDGVNWTKQGLVLQSAGGWEGSHVHDPTAVYDHGRILLYYVGENGPWQIGRADSLWDNGSYVGHVDFGGRTPATLQAAYRAADLPAGSSATVFVRSSHDNSAWTTWESLGSGGNIPTTPARRFVEWRVDLSSVPARDAPTLRGAWLDYTAYRPSARYISSLFTFPEQVAAVALTLTPPAPANTTVSMAVSNDNGTSWLTVNQGNFTDLVTAGGDFLYRLDLEGTTSLSPSVDVVTLALQLRGYPAAVTLRLGTNGTAFANVTGPLSGAVNISLPTALLNTIIADTRTMFPGATFIDVPFFVTSSHFGLVRLSEPRLTLELKNPLNATFDPPGPVVGIFENSTTTFGTAYTVFPSWVKVNITWWLDGAEIAGQRDQLEYNFTADFASAGNYSLTAVVENGDFAFNHTWAIEVYNVNRPPVFSFIAPATPFSMSHAASANFTAQASDADNEPLAWGWALDGFARPEIGPAAVVGGLSPGLHVLTVTVSDPWGAIEFSWTITSTNAPPRILSRSPSADFNLSHTAAQVVRVDAVDADGEALSFEWVLDGVRVANETGRQLTLSGLAVGAHTLSLTVRDAYTADATAWIIFSTNALPVVATAFPAGDLAASHRASVDFIVAFTDADGDPLSVRWLVDGVERSNGSSSFRLDPVGLGPRTVVAVAGDGYGTASRFWNVTGTNAAPVVKAMLPAANLTLSVVDIVQLGVDVQDPDGDAVNYSWWLGVVPLNSTSPEVSVGPLADGNWEVSARMSDGLASALAVFRLNVFNFGPTITSAAPSGDFELPHNTTRSVTVTAEDYEGDPLTYVWTLDGRVLPSTGPE